MDISKFKYDAMAPTYTHLNFPIPFLCFIIHSFCALWVFRSGWWSITFFFLFTSPLLPIAQIPVRPCPTARDWRSRSSDLVSHNVVTCYAITQVRLSFRRLITNVPFSSVCNYPDNHSGPILNEKL